MSAIVFMFSGQGSQYYQMGRELFRKHQTFRDCMHELDAMAHMIGGRSVITHLYSENKRKSDVFDKTLYTHPAIFMVEYALAQVLFENGIKPDYVLGTSIGEFTSAAVAEVMTFEESLLALIRQAEALESHCEEGGMLAILHDPSLYYETSLIRENSDLASINYYSHFVISSQIDNLHRIEQHLRERGIAHQALPVTKAFHSSFIDQAAKVYGEFLSQKSYQAPRIPFVSCVSASIMTTIRSGYFWEVVRKPIRFQEALKGLETDKNCIYLDLGPAGTLANFVKYNLPADSESTSLAVLTPFGKDMRNLEKIESIFR